MNLLEKIDLAIQHLDNRDCIAWPFTYKGRENYLIMRRDELEKLIAPAGMQLKKGVDL